MGAGVLGSEALGDWGRGLEPCGGVTDVRTFVGLDGQTEFSPVFYRTSFPSGSLPKSANLRLKWTFLKLKCV